MPRQNLQLGVLFGLAALMYAALSGCNCGELRGRRPRCPIDSKVTQAASTEADTTEAAGAREVPLLAFTLYTESPMARGLPRIRVEGEGDLDQVEQVQIFEDVDGNRRVSSPDLLRWTGVFEDGVTEIDDAGMPLEPFVELHVLITCDIAATAPTGAAFRARIPGDSGGMTVQTKDGFWALRTEVLSGWRSVGDEAMLLADPVAFPARRICLPGDDGISVVGLERRATSSGAVDETFPSIEDAGTGMAGRP